MNDIRKVAGTAAEKPMVIPIEAYVSEDYARNENEKLWAKVWQSTCREEEIPKVGDYVTYAFSTNRSLSSAARRRKSPRITTSASTGVGG